MSVRVRFAPSNTGYLHMGGARTALFNYLFARHNDGTFILRVEDTDLKRSKPEYTEAILDAMDWLSMPADEGPIFQSDRTDLYTEKARQLLDEGKAYKCYASQEEVDDARQAAMEAGERGAAYSRIWRDRTDHPDDEPYVVRIKMPLEGELTIDDLVQGEVTVSCEELDDFIILRSDGSPTYNFVVVVDDATMDVSHVIRGKDHLNNTFRQLPVYEALGYEPPRFGHLPLVAGLSKRKGSAAVQDYRDRGFLAEAVNNYIARLGWSHGDQELFSMDELIEYFGFDHVGRSESQFDEQKFLWVNSEWMKRLEPADLAERWLPFIHDAGYADASVDDRLVGIAETMRERAKTLVEMTEISSYFFADEIDYDDKAVKKWLKPSLAEPFGVLVERLEALDGWDREALESIYRDFCDEYDLGLGKVAQPTRVSVTGGTSSPGLFETLELLGRDRALGRLRHGVAVMEERAANQ